MLNDLLFVYGTLRPGAGQAARLVAAERIGLACLSGAALYALPAGYPGIVLTDRETDYVRGDLFRMQDPETMLRALDRYEEAGPDFPSPQEYARAQVMVMCEERTYNAWTYIYTWPLDGPVRIDGGDWIAVQPGT